MTEKSDDSMNTHEKQNSNSSDNTEQKRTEPTNPVTREESEQQATTKKTKSTNRNYFALNGELEISRVEAKVSSTKNMPFESSALVVDKKGRAFGRASLQVRWEDGKDEIVVLDAKQVELLLKLIKVVPL